MICPDCGHQGVKTDCYECGWKAHTPKPSGGVSRRKPLRSVQCAFMTGAYQCQWGKLTREHHGLVYCDFHREALRHERVTTRALFELLLTEREFYTTTYTRFPLPSWGMISDPLTPRPFGTGPSMSNGGCCRDCPFPVPSRHTRGG